MSTSVGVETLTDTTALGLTVRIQSTCFLWSSTEYTLWNGKGENSDVHATASRIEATTSVVLPPRRWPPNPGFAPCAYLNSTNRARWMVSSRTPKSPVATCVMIQSAYGASSSGYPPSPVLVNVPMVFAAMARASIVWRLTEPNDIPPP